MMPAARLTIIGGYYRFRGGIEYPHFVYHSALDYANTFSEGLHFCRTVTAGDAAIATAKGWIVTS